MWFTQAGLEQASSERMARHHARRYASFERIADLCSGIGGDLIGLAADRQVVAVDMDPVHIRLAVLNAEANAVLHQVSTVCADVRDVDLRNVSAAFIDPARRSSDRRFRAGTSNPPLNWCFALADRGTAVGIKAAPGLPLDLVPAGWELEFVSEDRELKESALWSPTLATTQRRATILPGGETLQTGDAIADICVDAPGRYLLDVDPAVTRAGLVDELATVLGDCWKIDPQIGFLSSDRELVTPFGRTLRVEASEAWSLSRLRTALRTLNVGTVDIRKRGSAVDVDDLQRRLKLTGTRRAIAVLTRVSDKPWMLVCSELSSRT